MELNQLYYFRVAAETQNLTEAAEKLHISQPTLSSSMKNWRRKSVRRCLSGQKTGWRSMRMARLPRNTQTAF